MKKWQKDRNYRRIRNEGGEVSANVITVDGVDVEVTEAVYLAYSQMDRNERYQEEQREDNPHASLELLEENKIPIDLYLREHEISAEDTVLLRENELEQEAQKERLSAALESLTVNERELVQALFFDGISAREYARQLGVYHRTVLYRKEKLLEKLRKKLF